MTEYTPNHQGESDAQEPAVDALVGIENYSELPATMEPGLLPAGDYLVECIGAEVRATKAGTMNQIVLMHRVLSPTNVGAVIFDRINMLRLPDYPAESLDDKLRMAIQIGNSRRKCFEMATGGRRASAASEYVGRICRAVVRVRPATPAYPKDSNEISRYISADSAPKPNIPGNFAPGGDRPRAKWTPSSGI